MKLAEALKLIQSAPPGAPSLPVSLHCGFTPLHLETFLRAHLCRLFPDRLPEIKTGLYGDLIGGLQHLEEVSAAVVVIEWPDLDPRLGLRRIAGWDPSQLPDILREVRTSADRLQIAIAAAARNVPAVVCFPTLPLVPICHTTLAQAGEFRLELRSIVVAASAALSRVSGVKVVDSQRLDVLSPSNRLDVNSDLSAGFPYTLPHASALAELVAELIRNRPPKKGLITDLDHTLWRGILGEVGIDGISWDLDHRSQIHALYQQVLRSLAASGALIAVASKNDPELVKQAFATRDPILRSADIFPFEVHWGPKSESVSRILAQWNISSADVVCVDDSPMELAEIKAVHPEASCLVFPRENPQEAYALLESLRDLFGKDRISTEDALRSASLRANAELQQSLKQQGVNDTSHADPVDFIRQLEGTVTLTAQKQPLDPRALELVNKTNQFSLNGRRFQEAEWHNWVQAPETVLVAASYRDKYGPLGKISVLAGDLSKCASSGKRKLCVRTWVMSCRAFSRLIEYECLRWLFSKLDLDELEFDFLPTPRNMPIRDFLRQVRNAPAEPYCRLSRPQFMKAYPASVHQIEESMHD